jgi:hypothetical protein
MLKKTVQYENFDGETVYEDCYFNLTKAELVDMSAEYGEGEDMAAKLRKIANSNNKFDIIPVFKDILRRAYGRRSEDGKRFVKKPEYWDEFVSSEPFSVIFMEICTDGEKSAEFIRAIIPKDLTNDIAKIGGVSPTLTQVDEVQDPRPAWIREDRDPTETELSKMSHVEIAQAMRRRIASK